MKSINKVANVLEYNNDEKTVCQNKKAGVYSFFSKHVQI